MSTRHELRVDLARPLLADPRHGHNRLHPEIPPALVVDPGDEVDLDVRDGFDGQIGPGSRSDDVRRLDLMRGHSLTGPIAVRGADPGDLLEVEILAIETRSFGYTAVVPGIGLAGDRFTEPYLVRWDLADGVARSVDLPGVAITGRPFLGFIAVAPSLAYLGETTRRERALADEEFALLPDPTSAVPAGRPAVDGLRTLPPREIGGNLDVRHATAGSLVLLPVQVPGALCSLGDPHFAQGDGESCGLALETSATIRVRFGVRAGAGRDWIPSMPMIEFTEMPRNSQCIATLGIAPHLDAHAAARHALNELIDHLVAERGFTEAQACVLAGVAADLQISALVNAPNAIVAAVLPLDVFDDEGAP
jgi:formamidase